ncbi:PQQ-dependent sugar dehydrogenase [Ralstonia pseudosolanacearum]
MTKQRSTLRLPRFVLQSVCRSVLILFALGGAHVASAHGSYSTAGTCGGYPRIDLKTAPGICVGLVAEDLGFARGVATIGNDTYVVDMGGWMNNRGRLLHLRDKQPPQVLLAKLDRPNAILATPDKRLLIGVAGRIVSIDPAAADPASTLKALVVNLPSTGRHPLTAMTLAPDGSLYINVGSATDHCEGVSGKPDPSRACPETQESPPRGAVLRARSIPDKPMDAAQLQVFAIGLRNAMALAVSPKGQVISAVNARDLINLGDAKLSDEALPHDTLNWLTAGSDYGWPYCFDNNRSSPEYAQYDCSKKTPPTRLLPPHAAPLGMLIYRGDALPGQDRHLIIGYHGYRRQGHRIVSLTLDGAYRPRGEPRNLVWGWDAVPGRNPMGAPVGLAQLGDGSLLVVEDRNGTLLKIAPIEP